ncbi:MAG TPA: HAD family hydrolase [Candidatus Dormibacteraeota bacterium]|nr:HAD family hydrolase [Candidatus Dormibacteraeota bacterium]
MIRGPHRAVLFDLFDTLVRIDSEKYLAGKREAARLLSVPPDRFIEVWIAAGEPAQTGVLPDIAARIRYAARACGAEPDETLVSRMVRLEEEHMTSGSSLYPDVLPTLAALRARPGVKTGLVSNASSTAAMLFERLGLSGYFKEAVFSFRVGVLKPQPEIYLKACEALHVQPAECLFVGDGNGFELDGAGALGMETVRVERPFTAGPFRKGESLTFDATVDDLTRVLTLVRT